MDLESKKSLIHFAIDSMCKKNICTIINTPTTNLDVKFKNESSLIMLSNRITDDNFNDIYECIKCLIENGANLFIKNSNKKTANDIIRENTHLNNENKNKLLEVMRSDLCFDSEELSQ